MTADVPGLIDEQITTNGANEINGAKLNAVLKDVTQAGTAIINVNNINTKAEAYEDAATARDAVPESMRKAGAKITYLLAAGWMEDQFNGADISGWGTASNWKTTGPVSVSQNILTIGNNPKYNIKSIFGALSLALLDISNIVSRLSPGEFGLNTSSKKIYYKIDSSNYLEYNVTKDGLYEYNGEYYRFDGTNIVKLPLYTPITEATNMLPKFDENGNLINSGQLLLNDGNLFLKGLGGYTGNGVHSGKDSINGILRYVSFGLLRSLCCRHNGWIGLDGVLVDASIYDCMYYSDLIPVKGGVNIHYCVAQAAAKDANNKYQYIWFYDVNGSFISAITADSASSNQVGTITANDIPTNAYYFRFVINTNTFEFAIGLDLGSFLPQNKEYLLATFKDDYDWQQGYVAQNSISTAYADAKYNNKLIPVVPNVTYRIDGTQENAYYVQIFNRERQRVRSVKASVSGSVTTMTLTILPNEYYIRLSYKLSSNKGLYIYQINGMADALAKSLMEEEIAPLQCPIVYGRTLNANYYRFNNSLYAEGFASKQQKLLIDGGIESTPNQTQQNGDFSTPIKLTSGNTQEIISIRRKNKDVANVSGKAFVLCIGESTTQNAELNPKTGVWGDLWGWPSAMQYFNEIDKSDGSLCAIKTIGRHLINLMPNELQFQYKGRNLTNRSFNEGFSGWTSYGFLYWPCRVSIYPSVSRFGAATMWYALGLYTKTPYSQTNYNTTTEPYTGSDEQIALMTKTPFGYYKIDGNADVWSLIRYLGTQSEYPSFTGTGDYTGSEEQIALMQSWCDELGSNPINPFYSQTKARVSNTAIAFDLNLYLQRYRTCDDLGITLTGSAGQSVIGSDGLTYTIGTKVTDTTLYDVCTPTHIILNIGNNESAAGMNKVANAVSNIKDFVGLFNIPVGYFVTRHPGVLAKGLWDENYITKQYVLDAFVNEMVATLYEWFESQSGKYMLPIFQIQPPVSVTGEFFESGILKDKLNVSYDNIHPGWSAYKAIGFQCLSWLYNIL